MCPPMRHFVMPLVLGVSGGVNRVDSCYGGVRFLDYIAPNERKLIISGKQYPLIRAFGQFAQDLPIVPSSEI